MQQYYGVVNDSFKNYEAKITHRALDLQQYVVARLTSCDKFYNVTSELEGLPNFMVWYDSQLDLSDYLPLPPKMILDALASYLANMTDEERELFDPTLERLISYKEITRITCLSDSFEIHTYVAGKPKLLLVTVMNMIDTSASSSDLLHWRSRSTLN